MSYITPTIWTAKDVSDRLSAAAETLMAMRLRSTKPSIQITYWPEVVRNVVEAYGYDAAQARKPIPSAEKITQMDEAIGWLWWVDKECLNILWARACGVTWRKLEDMDGRSRQTLSGIHSCAISMILRRLNAGLIAVANDPWNRATRVGTAAR